jgi:hypothetical protein
LGRTRRRGHTTQAAEVIAAFQQHCRTVEEYAIADLICDLGLFG